MLIEVYMVNSLDAVDEPKNLNNMHSVLRQSTDTVSILYTTNSRKKTNNKRKCFKHKHKVMIIQTIQRKSTTENAGYTDRAVPRKTRENHI